MHMRQTGDVVARKKVLREMGMVTMQIAVLYRSAEHDGALVQLHTHLQMLIGPKWHGRHSICSKLEAASVTVATASEI